MKALIILIALAAGLIIGKAEAQGFQDEPTCYSWSGGHKSSGSFSKCGPELQPIKKAPPPPPVVAQVAPVAAPVVIKETIIQECPKPVPANKPVFIKKRPPKVTTCK